MKGKNWEKVQMNALSVEATEKEVEDSLLNIQKNYADYKDTDTIAVKDTLSKLGLNFLIKKERVWKRERPISEKLSLLKTSSGRRPLTEKRKESL